MELSGRFSAGVGCACLYAIVCDVLFVLPKGGLVDQIRRSFAQMHSVLVYCNNREMAMLVLQLLQLLSIAQGTG